MNNQQFNLTEYYQTTFEGYFILEKYIPYYEEYLAKIKSTLDQALSSHPKAFALRVDLKYPRGCDEFDSRDISRFIDSLSAKLRAELQRKNKSRIPGPSEMYYVWAREFGPVSNKPHYHLLILLNWNDFKSLGKFSAEGNGLFAKIAQAWSSSLGMRHHSGSNVPVTIAENPGYVLERGNNQWNEKFCDLFYRSSYLAKVETKRFGDNKRSFSVGRAKLA